MLAHNLGHTWHGLGDERRAREHFRESLVLYRNMGDTRGVAECVAGLACLEADRCSERAVRWFAAARPGVAAIGTELSLSNQPQYESALAEARAGLGEKEFERLLGGEAVSLQVAVGEVLSSEAVAAADTT